MGVEAIVRVEDPPGASEFPLGAGAASVLVGDDEPGMRNFLSCAYGPRCTRMEEAASIEEACANLNAKRMHSGECRSDLR